MKALKNKPLAIVHYFLISLVLAFGTSAIFFLPLFFKRQTADKPTLEWSQTLQGLSLAAGFVAGALYAYHGWPTFPPIDSTHWVLWGLIPTLLASGLAIYLPRWIRLRFGLRCLLGAGLFYLIYFPLRSTGPLWLVCLGMGVTAVAWACWGLGSESVRFQVPIWVSVLNAQILSLGSLFLFLAGSSALLAQLAAVVMVSLIPALCMGFVSQRSRFYPPDLLFFLLAALWIAALLFSSLQALAVLLLLALAFPLLAKAFFPIRWQNSYGWAGVLFLTCVWVGGCVFWAYPAGPELYYG